MTTKRRIGVLGLTHDHIWDNLPYLAASDRLEFVAAADPNAPLTQRVRSEYGCPVFDTAEALLDSVSLDGIYLYGNNAESAAVAAVAADRGLHVLVEKPMAATLAGAEAMLHAARRSGVRLVVNWPFAWWPQLQHALRLVADGAIGRPWQVKYRAAHAGPKELGCSEYFCDWLFDAERNGAGAFMDYCCYGALLARVVLGVPERVTGTTARLCKHHLSVEDNGHLAMEYAQAFATAEGSWTQVGKLTSYLTAIFGTEGTMLVEPRVGGKLLLADAAHPEGVEVPVPAPAPALRDSAAHFAHAIDTGEILHPLCRPEACRDVQEILEAGLRSAETRASVALPLT